MIDGWVSGDTPELPLVARDGSTVAAARQLDLPLGTPSDSAPALIVTQANAAIVTVLERPADWPANSLILTGPRRSGRSLHARLAAERGARVLDDVHARPEEELFDAWNAAQGGPPLLLVADSAPPTWQLLLPDLRSRLATSGVASLGDPDDAMADALLELLLLRRGVPSSAALRREAAQPLPRTHLSLARLVELIPGSGPLTRDAIRHAHQSLGVIRLDEAA